MFPATWGVSSRWGQPHRELSGGRGSVGSEMSLKDSDAHDALVEVRSDEPYYALVTAELGAVAAAGRE